MIADGKFDKIQEVTQLIKENETELKTLAKNVNELTFTMDAQANPTSIPALASASVMLSLVTEPDRISLL